METPYSKESLAALIEEVSSLKKDAVELERQLEADLRLIPESCVESARNLIHYLAVRRSEIRPLQEKLHELGLSSLGRMEPYVMASLNAVLAALKALCGEGIENREGASEFGRFRDLLEQRSKDLLGDSEQAVRIMVTLPNEDAEGPNLLVDLLEAGMNVMRVNCAKGNPREWKSLIDDLRRAEKKTGRSCRTLFDLEGPNPRTVNVSEKLVLAPGDLLAIHCDDRPSKKVKRDAKTEEALEPGEVSINLAEVLRDVRKGESVVFDDGKIEGKVVETEAERILVKISLARKGRAKLGNGKGINFPDTDLQLSPLADVDLENLDFIVDHADLIGFSFVRSPKDVERLQGELRKRGKSLGLVMKIETRKAFEALPKLLLTALREPPVGVMIARGDMGAELGFQRMAEVQEEMLWICEATHVPVIWATQVLESLAKSGVPTRGEMTDAALSVRAECVMLNKGKHIVDTVRFLSRLLDRMSTHQRKKWSLLRRLNVADMDEA